MAKRQTRQEALQEQVVTLRADGATYSEIAERTALPVQEFIDLSAEESYKVSTLRAVRMETLITTQRVDHRGRIEQLSHLQSRLREELERRDLSDLPTDKLVTLLLKTSEALKGEVTTPEILSSEAQRRNERQSEMWNNW